MTLTADLRLRSGTSIQTTKEHGYFAGISFQNTNFQVVTKGREWLSASHNLALSLAKVRGVDMYVYVGCWSFVQSEQAEVQSFRRHQDRGYRDQSRLYFAPDVNLNTGLFLGRCKTMPAYPRQNTDLTLDHFHGYFTAFPELFLQRLVFLLTGGRASMHADAHSTSVSPTVRYRMPSAGSTARCNFLPAETIPPGSKLETHKAQDGPETYRVHKHSHPPPGVCRQ